MFLSSVWKELSQIILITILIKIQIKNSVYPVVIHNVQNQQM